MGQQFNTRNTQQWRISSAIITADRGIELDVKDSIVELVLYESLDKPYCTGQIAIAVHDAFVDENNFMGSERINIVIESQGSGSDIPENSGLNGRNFVMSSIESVIKSNEEGTGSIYVFTLIDEHAVANKLKKISRKIGGGLPLEVEIFRLVAELGKNCSIQSSKTKQGTEWKGYIPYLNPLEACEWLRDRATTETEMPLFLYASMHSNDLILSSLDVLMGKASINPNPEEHYIYSSADNQNREYVQGQDVSRSLVDKERAVKTFRASKMQNQFNLALQGGATGSTILTTNINGDPLGQGDIQFKHHPITRTIGLMEGAGITRGGQQNVYDPQWSVIGAGTMHENDAAIIHQILSENEYTKDWKSIHFESEIDKHQSKLSTIAMMAMLYKNCFEVTIDGAKLLKKKAGVGDIISIDVISDYLKIEDKKTFDKLKSGEFLILNTRHTFKVPSHNVVLTVTKVSRDS